MQININELLSFDNFYKTIATQKLPIKVSYKLAKIYSLLSTEINFYNNRISEIIDKYAIKNNGEIQLSDDKTNILIQEDKINQCNEELNELNSIECNIPVEDYLLQIEELPIECSVQEINQIIKFIK